MPVLLASRSDRLPRPARQPGSAARLRTMRAGQRGGTRQLGELPSAKTCSSALPEAQRGKHGGGTFRNSAHWGPVQSSRKEKVSEERERNTCDPKESAPGGKRDTHTGSQTSTAAVGKKLTMAFY